MPTEHGGWGLTAEPALLGLLVRPSIAGFFIGCAALLAFLARTPLKVLLVDRHRSRSSRHAGLAARILAAELVLLAGLVCAATLRSGFDWWWPAAIAGPLVLVELWFDMRSRGRRLVPELAGSVGICATAAMAILAAGGSTRLAAACWLVPAGRAVTAIPAIRAQIARLRSTGTTAPRTTALADSTAIIMIGAAEWLWRSTILGVLAVAAMILTQRVATTRPVPPPKVMGYRQMIFGFAVVGLTALGVHVL
jgi:hypothetical protein